MNNDKVKEIIKFSFIKNIQNKWFIIFNILTLISIVLMVNWSSISNLFKPKDELKVFDIVLIDNSNLVYDSFVEKFSDDKNYKLTKSTENTYTAENIPDDLVILEVTPDEEKMFTTSVISKEGIETTKYNPIKDTLLDVRNKLFAEKYNVTDEELDIFQSDLEINRIMLSVNAENSTTKEFIKLFSSAFTYIITVFIFSKMANEIASEKQSKSTEYILTTVSSKEYLFAKIFSNIAILLVQGLFLIVYYYIAAIIFNLINIASTDLSLSTVTFSSILSKDIVYYILALIIYNVLNLILLCIIQATVSSKVNSTTEAGNTVSLLIFVILLAYVATVYIITPYTKMNLWVYIVSCIPVLSAYFVPAMMVIGQATIWQIIISLAILIASIPILFHYSAKTFKNGILDYTKVKIKNKKEKTLEEQQKIYLTKRKMQNVGFVIGIAIIIYFGLQTVLTLLCGIVLPTLFSNLSETDITLIMQIILQVISLGVSAFWILSYVENKKEKRKKVNLKNKICIILIALLLIFGLQYLLNYLLYPAIGLDYSTTDVFDISSNSSLLSKIIFILAISVTPAIFEELFFRKAVISFTKQYGTTFALIFSALLFGMLHMNLSQFLFAFIIGIVFGMIYLYTNDIKITMFIHFINNGLAAIELILPESYGIIIVLILLVCLVLGLALALIMLSKKRYGEKFKNICLKKVSLSSFNSKYKYIFTDYTFDISMILVVLMSILTENMLR